MLVYVVLSTLLGGLWHAAFGPRHHHHHGHGGAARHRSIIETAPDMPPPLDTDATIHGPAADAEDADTLLSMLGQQPIVTQHADQAQHAQHAANQNNRRAGAGAGVSVGGEVQREVHHEPGELPPLEEGWVQPRRGFGLYADTDDPEDALVPHHDTPPGHAEAHEGLVDTVWDC